MSNLNAINNAINEVRHNNPKPIENLINSDKLSDVELAICLNTLAMHKTLKELEDYKDSLLVKLGRSDADISYLESVLKKADPVIAEEAKRILA